MVQGVRQLPYGPAVTQVSLPNQPDLMGTPVQAHTLRPGDMPTAPTQFETHGPCHRNATSENSAQFNGEQNGHVVSHHSNPWIEDMCSFNKQYSELMGVTRNPIATITPADFPQAFAATSTLVPADYPQVFPYQRRTVTPADYPLMYPCGPSPYLGCSTSQPVVQSL
jgi:hypothetical protein